LQRCPYCLQEADVLYANRLFMTETRRLTCGHSVSVNLEKEKGGTMQGKEKTCPACAEKYTTYMVDRLSDFCQQCRADLGIHTPREAEEMLEMLELCPVDQRTEIVKECKVRRGARALTPSQAQQTTAPVKTDPEKVAAAVRAMIEYGRLAHEVTPETPLQQPTAYVIAKSGLFEVRHSDIADIVVKAKEVAGVTADLQEGVKLNVPKVPFEFLRQTVAFFREACKKAQGSSEAYLQIWWNTQEQAYSVHVPEQNVSGASVNHRGAFDQEGARTAEGEAIWLHVMDIHSHGASMSAFWSGTDDGDERKAPEGRMFGVIGDINQTFPTWKWRMRSREGFIELRIQDIFEVDPAAKLDFHVGWDVILQVLGSADGVKDGMLRLMCPVDAFKNATCPPEWLEAVQTRGMVQHVHGSFQGGRHLNMGHSGAWGGSGNGLSERAPVLIYILSPDKKWLEEYEVADGSSPRKTGYSFKLGKEPHVH
jgi:PRTRC genetic system protein A